MPSFLISCFQEHFERPNDEAVVVAIDVLRASTTAITAVEQGVRVYPAGSIESAVRLAADLNRPILAGELGGQKPYGFDIHNSPCAVLELPRDGRPMVLLSTTGTRLMTEASGNGPTFVACLRNVTAQAKRLVELGRDVVLIGAESRGEFRDEDKLCASRIARALEEAGFHAVDPATAALVGEYGTASVDLISRGPSARYLRDTGQLHDLEYVQSHVDDLPATYCMRDRELVRER